MLFDFIEFENRRFAVRTLDLGEEFGICSIASESLNDLLLKIGGSYASHEAELVDERIFFFIDQTKLALPDKKTEGSGIRTDSMIRFQFFPRSHGINHEIQDVIKCFEASLDDISSADHELNSNEVLAFLRPYLEKLGFKVEAGKANDQKISVPVLFGLDNKIDKSFNADAVSSDGKVVIEVEAGRAVANNQFLKDIFQACMMYEVEYLVIAVRNLYRGSDDFSKIYAFLETLYISNRLRLPLKGILLIGY